MPLPRSARYLDERYGPQEPPEFFPTVIIDASIGEHLSDFSVNLDAINTTLLENGLTEEEINDTTIVFKARMPRVSREGTVTQGRYKAKQRRLDNFPARRIQRRIEYLEDAKDQTEREFRLEKMGKYLGWDLSETLRHEMEHHIVHVHGGMPEQKSLDQRQKTEAVGIICTLGANNLTLTDLYEWLSPSETAAQMAASQSIITTLVTALSAVALTSRFKHYYKISPEEARARKATDDDLSTYITTRFKIQDEHEADQLQD